MKLDLVEAAKSLGMHPLRVVMCLAPLVDDFSDVWPAVEEGLVATLKQMLGKHGIETEKPRYEAEGLSPGKCSQSLEYELNAAEIRCLRKLAKKGFWDKKTLPETALLKSYLQGSDDPAVSIVKLVRLGLLLKHGRHQYSLNPKAGSDIKNLISRNQQKVEEGER